jgi:endogenous inhibitor of DNA gyrase (YacG/DUF329 family)
MATATCPECGKAFKRPPSHLARVKRPTCSNRCKGVERGKEWGAHGHKGRAAWTAASEASFREKMSGERNHAWKGGVTYWRKAGNYPPIKYVRCPEWALPMARKDGYVMEHRLVMATLTGYLLTRTEVVHHLNHDPLDNRPANLELWPDNRTHKLAEHGRPVDGAACRLSRAV